jgi:hypothetical protein
LQTICIVVQYLFYPLLQNHDHQSVQKPQLNSFKHLKQKTSVLCAHYIDQIVWPIVITIPSLSMVQRVISCSRFWANMSLVNWSLSLAYLISLWLTIHGCIFRSLWGHLQILPHFTQSQQTWDNIPCIHVPWPTHEDELTKTGKVTNLWNPK